MTPIRILFTTLDSEEKAREIAHQLIDKRLAACVNIVSNVTSVYKWKGSIERATECLLMIKTSEDRVEQLTQHIKELHPYEVPEIISLSVEHGHVPYLDWVVAETR